jgi:hypothetical protein
MSPRIVFLAALALLGAAKATTITAGGGTGAAQFVTTTGVLLTPTNASIQVGTYNSTTNVFTQFATGDLSPITFSTVAALRGRWIGNAVDNSPAANLFNGQPIWLRIDVDLGAGTTGTAYFGSTSVFPTHNGGVADNLQIQTSSFTSFDADASTPGTAAFQAPGNGFPTGWITIGVVPEPSAGLLSVLGAIGLLRRRR